MIKPFLQDDAFLEDVARAARTAAQLHLWWLGQSGFLIQCQGRHLLIDPYLSDSLTRKYEGTRKPHVRMTERVIAPERLDFVDVVTSSHNHTDHLDPETLLPLWKANPELTVVVSGANVGFAAERLAVSPASLTPIHADGEAVQAGPFTLHAIPSAHEELQLDEEGDHRFIGLVVQAGGRTVYHSGDCVPYPGLEDRLKKWSIDLALLPINGRDPGRGVAGNFSGPEAVGLAQQVQAGLLIPCHYEMFEFNSVSPADFVQAAQAAGQSYRLARCGERIDL